jgi:hypothetical protein
VLREDVGVEPGRAEVSLEGQGVAADGVAVGEGGQELVDRARHDRIIHEKNNKARFAR